MKYFNTLPLLTQVDKYNNSLLLTNLLTRSYLIPSLAKNVMLFYEYDIQEGDTPENIAYKYYGNPYQYWIIFYSNNIIDPQSQWPLTSQQFLPYLYDKYKQDTANNLSIPVANVTTSQVMSYTSASIHHYEKIIITTDTQNMQNKVVKVNIDQNTYNELMSSTVQRTFTSGEANGVTITVKTDKNAVSIYNYELDLNESKRKINIMKDFYATQTENEFIKLMGQ